MRSPGAHGVGAPAIGLAFLIAEGHAAIPASSNPDHLRRSNLAAMDVRLSPEEIPSASADSTAASAPSIPAKSPRWDD